MLSHRWSAVHLLPDRHRGEGLTGLQEGQVRRKRGGTDLAGGGMWGGEGGEWPTGHWRGRGGAGGEERERSD